MGDVFAVPLKDGNWGYGKYLISRGRLTWFGFYDLKSGEIEGPAKLVGRRYILKLNCGDHGIRTGRWPVLVNTPPTADESSPPVFRKFDDLSGTAYRVTINEMGDPIPKRAKPEEVKDLPLDGAWSYSGAEDLLQDAHDGTLPDRLKGNVPK